MRPLRPDANFQPCRSLEPPIHYTGAECWTVVCATVADGLWLAAAIGGLALGFALFRQSVQRNLRELDGLRAKTNELYRIRDSATARAFYRGPQYAYNEHLRDPALDGSPAWGLPDAMPTTRVAFPSLD